MTRHILTARRSLEAGHCHDLLDARSTGATSAQYNHARPGRCRTAGAERPTLSARCPDQITVESAVLGAPRRRGEIIEVIGEGDRQHDRVRCDDGHESVYFPGPDAGVAGRA
jgi:hypothetical protein